MPRIMALALVAMMGLAACSHGGDAKDSEEEQGAPTAACPAASPALATTPKLPAKFPSPREATYTASSKPGPSLVVVGYFSDDLDGAFAAYKDAFQSAGYTLTKSEQDPRDAELDWSGQNTTGEVKMDWSCTGRTELTITVRPA
ncbi:MAG: hypothetical protein ACJ77A_05110 [Actinomycetota bacterium]